MVIIIFNRCFCGITLPQDSEGADEFICGRSNYGVRFFTASAGSRTFLQSRDVSGDIYHIFCVAKTPPLPLNTLHLIHTNGKKKLLKRLTLKNCLKLIFLSRSVMSEVDMRTFWKESRKR